MNTVLRALLGSALLCVVACADEASEGDVLDATEAADAQEAEPLAQLTGPAIGFGCRSPKIALRTANGSYVVAENGGGAELAATRIAAGPWETFTVGDQGFTKITLQAANGNYVVAENGGGGTVNANRTAVGPWEIFTVQRVSFLDNVWAFQASNGQYLVAENGGGGAVNANRTAIGPWEKFTVICM